MSSPKEYTFEDIHKLAREIVMKPLPVRDIPLPLIKLGATLLDKLPYYQMPSPDLITRVRALKLDC